MTIKWRPSEPADHRGVSVAALRKALARVPPEILTAASGIDRATRLAQAAIDTAAAVRAALPESGRASPEQLAAAQDAAADGAARTARILLEHRQNR